MSQNYSYSIMEKKWQKYWEENKSFSSKSDQNKEKYYILEMLPYPSGKVHMGHIRNYTLGDVVARFKMLQGYNVLHPMGWDAFGLPAENAAKQSGVNPKLWTDKNIDEMRSVLKNFGFSYDWDRELKTCDVEYYKEEQEFFIKLYEKGLIYQKESFVNWDPVDKTVLANEQVINGKGWRSGALVEKKKMKQWFCRITAFADELLEDIKKLDKWPESIRTMQTNWIGKSEGAIIKFEIANSDEHLEIYTTRPDTIFGCSFIGIAYDHPLVEKIKKTPEAEDFIKKCKQDSTSQAVIETKEKQGIATGFYVKHPFDNKKLIPVHIANFVISTYGTGAIFGCPGHDERDNEFAKKYNLPIINVVDENNIIINSKFLNGLSVEDAKEKVIQKLEENGKGGYKKTNFKIHDWGISRQKYWGCPIPMIHCSSCGTIPVNSLPVQLPEDVDFSHTGNPLDVHPTWKHIKCHKCGGNAERETDTLDTFFESSWYFTSYCNEKNKGNNGITPSPTMNTTMHTTGMVASPRSIDRKSIDYWMPVDCYIGGAEHAVMHLLYARFFTKALRDLGYWNINEPFDMMFTQGMVCNMAYKDEKGFWVEHDDVEKIDGKYQRISSKETVIPIGSEKMSKSKKNGIDPEKYLEKYGADTMRMFVMSDTPPEKDFDWNDKAIEGVHKYLQKLYRTAIELNEKSDNSSGEDISLKKIQHKTIKSVTDCYNNMHINKAIAHIRELNNALNDSKCSISQKKEVFNTIVELISPITPHISAEISSMMKFKEKLWPSFDINLLSEEKINIAIQVNGKSRGVVEVNKDATQQEIETISKALPAVQNAIGNNNIRKVIYVNGKILNFVF